MTHMNTQETKQQESQLYPQGAGCPGSPAAVLRQAKEKGIPEGIAKGLAQAYTEALSYKPGESEIRVKQGFNLWKESWENFLEAKVCAGKLSGEKEKELAPLVDLWADGHTERATGTLALFAQWDQKAINALISGAAEFPVLFALGLVNGEGETIDKEVSSFLAVSLCNLSARRQSLEGRYTWDDSASAWKAIKLPERTARGTGVTPSKVAVKLADDVDFGDTPEVSEVKLETKKKGK